MNCVSEITNYVRAMKQSEFYPFCPHPHFILFVRIRILSFLSASAFYPFCPHPHFIPFVRIRILSLLSASAFYPFCPHPHFIPFVRIRNLSLLSASAFYRTSRTDRRTDKRDKMRMRTKGIKCGCGQKG